MLTSRGWGLIKLIGDGTDGRERGVVSKVPGRGPTVRQPKRQTRSATSLEALLPLFWHICRNRIALSGY